jgi:hypothetical protein
MTHKIYKYIYKINKLIKNKNFSNTNKLSTYYSHLKRHNNMSGGNIINQKIAELEVLLDKINKLPKFGINDALEQKLKSGEQEFILYEKEVSRVMRDIMSYHGLNDEANKLFP